jgi:hypothetical protein
MHFIELLPCQFLQFVIDGAFPDLADGWNRDSRLLLECDCSIEVLVEQYCRELAQSL